MDISTKNSISNIWWRTEVYKNLPLEQIQAVDRTNQQIWRATDYRLWTPADILDFYFHKRKHSETISCISNSGRQQKILTW